jgi:DNA-binding NarL/FixJ family response regulator
MDAAGKVCEYNCSDSFGTPAVPAIRTLLIGMSPIFSDIVVQIITHRVSLEIIAEVPQHEGLQTHFKGVTPHLVLCGLGSDEREQDVGSKLLETFPGAKVIVFSCNRRHAYLYQMRPVRAALLDLSPKILIQAILC